MRAAALASAGDLDAAGQATTAAAVRSAAAAGLESERRRPRGGGAAHSEGAGRGEGAGRALASDTESDGADTDGAQAEANGRPAGSWTDRCGFFGAKQIEEALADKLQITRAVFKGVKPKALIRVLRKSMIETAAEVWQKRLESLRSLP